MKIWLSFLLCGLLAFSPIFPNASLYSENVKQDTEEEEESTNQDKMDEAKSLDQDKMDGPELGAPSALLMEASTGKVVYEKNADDPLPPASVTKVMTLLLIYDALDEGKIHLEDEVTTSEYAASMGGSQVFLEVGEIQTVDTLIKCIAVASANDACVAWCLGKQI